MPELTADELRQLLQLEPLTIEGGYFRETYRSTTQIPHSALPPHTPVRAPSPHASTTCSRPTPSPSSIACPAKRSFTSILEIPSRCSNSIPNGLGEFITLGSDLRSGMRLQHIVPGNVWQGARLKAGGRFALMGTTVAPGFDYADYEAGDREELRHQFPASPTPSATSLAFKTNLYQHANRSHWKTCSQFSDVYSPIPWP